jgi:UDP-3-O-[3-hydroxymyristoyl] glucosamine N-acyltransferase
MGGRCINREVPMGALNLSAKLSEIAKELGGRLVGEEDPLITGVASLEDAGAGDLTFLANPKHQFKLEACRAAGVLVAPGVKTKIPAIEVAKPYHAFASFLEGLRMDLDRVFPPGIHATAVIDETAQIHSSAAIGPYCVVGADCEIGAGTRLGPHVCLGPEVRIGQECLVYAQVAIREGTRVGDRVILHAGCNLGTDGFGYVTTEQGPRKVPQVGIVVLEDDVEIGAGVCIDRATTGRTLIGAGTKIDNLVQIGHNVQVGRACAMSAQTGISGSCVLEDFVTLGGKVGIADHLRVGQGAQVAGMSGLIRDVPPKGTVFGYPALDFTEGFRIVGAMRKLPELLRRVARLERELAAKAHGKGISEE